MTTARKSCKGNIAVERVRAALGGRAVDVLVNVAGIPRDILDGSHHPCPKCGGEDRFRLVDEAAGAVLCNQCFDKKNGDFFAAVGWMQNCTFLEAVKKVEKYLGVPEAATGKADPGKDLRFLPDNDMMYAWFTRAKPGVTREGMKLCGARYAMYKEKYGVFAFPVIGKDLDTAKPVGWAIYSFNGALLPVWDRNGNIVDRVKVKLTAGSKPGFVGLHAVERMKAPSEVERVIKVEGITDLLAVQSIIPKELLDRHLVITNANGAKESPKWMSPVLARLPCVVVHDADQPGQEGAVSWSRDVAAHAKEGVPVCNVQLPYEIAETHGKDFRDYLNEGNTYGDFLALAEATEPLECGQDLTKRLLAAAEEFISNGEEVEVESPGETSEESETKLEPLSMPDILDKVMQITDGFPKRVGQSLFIHDAHGTCWFEKTPAMFGWLGQFRPVKWYTKPGFVTKDELFHELKRIAESFLAIEALPHEPPMPRHFYTCGSVESGDGAALDRLLTYFRPETTADGEMIKAMFGTPGWGGRPGSWPAFVITSDSGRGAGKSKLAEFVSYLWGGHMDVAVREDIETLKSRMLSAEALALRIALIDNAKAGVLSWADLENLMTAPTISGKRLYHGEATRPNTIMWIVTLNGPALSTDLAQRSIIIKLARGENYGNWSEDVAKFIDDNRKQLIADCLGLLRGPSSPLAKHSRWAAWEAAVLSKLRDPEEVQRVIIERQKACDADSDEMGIVEEFFHHQLEKLGYDADRASVRIPNDTVTRWYNWAVNDNVRTGGVTRRLKQAADEGQLHCLAPDPSRTYGRCFIWTGQYSDVTEFIQNDLRTRLATASQSKDA